MCIVQSKRMWELQQADTSSEKRAAVLTAKGLSEETLFSVQEGPSMTIKWAEDTTTVHLGLSLTECLGNDHIITVRFQMYY